MCGAGFRLLRYRRTCVSEVGIGSLDCCSGFRAVLYAVAYVRLHFGSQVGRDVSIRRVTYVRTYAVQHSTFEPPIRHASRHVAGLPWHNGGMPVIREQDIDKGRDGLQQWRDKARELAAQDDSEAGRLTVSPNDLPRPVWAWAVRYSLYLLERKAPGEGVEVRVAPWGAIKILDGPASDPHNLTPPDVIELKPDVWLRLACGITTWADEKQAGRISAVGERDDLSGLLPLV